MFPTGTLSVLEFSGHDAGHFLHNQLSADTAAIPVGGTGFACCCNPAGRVLALILVTVQQESIMAICASGLAQSIKDWLSRFIIRADVTIELRSDLVVVARPGSEPATNGFKVETASGLNYGIMPSSTILSNENDLFEQEWHCKELESGVAWLAPETSARFLPQMLGYDAIGALSFKKGCYPGQEIIARTRYLGNLKRRPLLIKTARLGSIDLMDKITVHARDTSFSAVVVDIALTGAGEHLLFTVVRSAEDIQPDAITIGGERLEILPF